MVTVGARSPARTGAWVTALYLLGGIAAGLGAALPISEIPTPGHPHVARNVVSGVVLLAVVIATSWLWGRTIAARTGCAEPRSFGKRAAASFAPTFMAVATALGVLEPVFAGAGAAHGYPIHVVFGMLFVPATFLVASITTFALRFSRAEWRTALQLALAVGGAAAMAFLAVIVAMDTIGWRVGAPGAAERATMLVVSLTGTLAAALAAGAVLGRGLTSSRRSAGSVAPKRSTFDVLTPL